MSELIEDAIGEWIVRRSQITRPDGTLMGRQKIKEALALPREPTHMVDFRPTRPLDAQVSTAAGREHGNIFGEGGKEQWRVLEDIKADPESSQWFINPRRLDE